MRTTVTLDPDVEETIREEMRSGKGKSFKHALNDLIRRARYNKTEKNKSKMFKVRSFNMGTYEHLNYDNIGELLDEIEGPQHR